MHDVKNKKKKKAMTNYYHNRFGKKDFPLCRTRFSKNIYYVNLILLFFFFFFYNR